MRSSIRLDLGNGDEITTGQGVDDAWLRFTSRNGQAFVVNMNDTQLGKLRDQLNAMRLSRK